MNIEPGTYQHYKGKLYEVLGVGHHSETLEELIIYRALYDSEQFGPNALWARTAKMFFDTVEFNSSQIPRFKKID